MPCGGLGTEHALAHLRHIEVDLQDALLGPQQFDEHGEPGLQPLAHVSTAGPEEYVLGGLLADGAASTDTPTLLVPFHGLSHGFPREAGVEHEALVLGGHHGQGQVARDGAPIGHRALDPILFVGLLHHHPGDRWFHQAQQGNPQGRDHHEPEGCCTGPAEEDGKNAAHTSASWRESSGPTGTPCMQQGRPTWTSPGAARRIVLRWLPITPVACGRRRRRTAPRPARRRWPCPRRRASDCHHWRAWRSAGRGGPPRSPDRGR